MKKLRTLSFICLLLLSQKGIAQLTQLEVVSGGSKTDFTSFSIQTLNKRKTLSISTLAFFQKYHQQKNEAFDESGVQGTLFFKLNKRFSIGPSLYHNSVAGFSERLSFMATHRSQKLLITIIPSVVHSQQLKSVGGEYFMQMQFQQPIKSKWDIIANVQMLSYWNKFSIHERSFQQIRTGISYNSSQFGLAIDIDQYGSEPVRKTSIGIFLKKTFLN